MHGFFWLPKMRCFSFAILQTVALVLFWVSYTRTGCGSAIKVGFSMGMTGANGPNGKQLIVALEIWRDDVNAKDGLLGRPVELVYYDDQTSPANEPSIYTKLIDVDKVDLLIGPYGTNQSRLHCPCFNRITGPRSVFSASPLTARLITRIIFQ